MKKSSSSSTMQKKKKTGKLAAVKSAGAKASALKPSSVLSYAPSSGDPVQAMLDQIKTAILERIDSKMNAVNIRLDRIETSLQEVLDEIRESESFLEEETEPYEGQA
ncbi:MAG TPA: hypothetical protein VN944_04345 [Nitrospiria bacterium]|nr:hypothetical protein [Nitrospiria bacterium]